jgi:glycosyltransferase involved in cell wall biosynthesis
VKDGSAPLVTIVIPAYGAEEFIEHTMRSVAAQTHRPMELIVVEDCSPDRTGEIAEKVARELSTDGFSVRVEHHEVNKGGAGALRAGFSLANGEFICWLSADDAYSLPEKTANQLDVMRRGADLVYDAGYLVGADEASAATIRPHWSRPRVPVPDSLYNRWPSWRLLALNVGNPINGSSVMIRREVVERMGTFDPALRNIDQDSDMWLRLTCLGARFGIADQVGTFYRLHAGQTSNLTEAVEWGCALARVRVLLALHEADTLGRLLNRAWPTLLLAPPGRFRHFSLVSQVLCTLGAQSDCGFIPRAILGRLKRELVSRGYWEPERVERLLSDAAESSKSDEFQLFIKRLRDKKVRV